MTTLATPGLATRITWVGTLLATGAALFGFIRELLMAGTSISDHHAMSSATNPLHGMPLADMPEMVVAVAGVLLALVGGVAAQATGQSAVARSGWQPTTRGARILVITLLAAALTIDVSKTSTLGFVIPGMRQEYGLEPRTASLLAVAGLTGTATGALLFGVLADRLGRRHAYLIATLGFTVTSMCGSMTTFTGNVVMCLLMGVSVGGLAPLLITMLGEFSGNSARGPLTTALSVVATAVGYLVAAGSALWLEPIYGWRIMWLIGAPTGALLVLATPLVPQHCVTPPAPVANPAHIASQRALSTPVQCAYAMLIGVVTFGLTTWLPTIARAGGVSAGTANLLLTTAALAMVPFAVLLAFTYLRLGPVALAAGLASATALVLLLLAGSGAAAHHGWLCAVALLAALFSVNTMAAVFLPIAADLADPARRGRVTGTVSFFNRLGGLTGPILLAGLVASVTDVLVAIAALATACAVASAVIGRRYRAAARMAVPATPNSSTNQ
ncbi:hypothetical protein GCM10012275_26970 [Longimycelium tulufanense]|uniref:Major facilitator superfamily (MFS) profile domain-containing protein n=1 Tax=Longimycelium tulufanense TaxID=907463 RepID=A0A8J3FUE9_9PSEU|nr:MFS transporter [Longimycelium tulufanense]GGM54462.1 hypothetical protein GCM10012275_26970 [Longimycelium tulufanense]